MKKTVVGSNSNTDCDQDSDVSFMNDIDEETCTAEIEEHWIEFLKRSTRPAEEKMKAAKVPCWIETHRTMKWRLAMRIASLPDERWAKKTAEWNPGLSIKQDMQIRGKTYRRWEDEIKARKMGRNGKRICNCRPLTKDQTGFDWQGIQALSRGAYHACGTRHAPRRSWSLKERAQTTRTEESATLFPLLFSTESEDSAVLLTQFLLQLSPSTQACL